MSNRVYWSFVYATKIHLASQTINICTVQYSMYMPIKRPNSVRSWLWNRPFSHFLRLDILFVPAEGRSEAQSRHLPKLTTTTNLSLAELMRSMKSNNSSFMTPRILMCLIAATRRNRNEYVLSWKNLQHSRCQCSVLTASAASLLTVINVRGINSVTVNSPQYFRQNVKVYKSSLIW